MKSIVGHYQVKFKMSKREGVITDKPELVVGYQSPSHQPDRPPVTDLTSLLQTHLAYISSPPPLNSKQNENSRLERKKAKTSPSNTFLGNDEYRPAQGSPGPGDGVDEDVSTLDAYMNDLEKEASAKGKGVTNAALGVTRTQEQQLRGFQKIKDVGASGSILPRVLKRGMIAKEHAVQLKAGRDDIVEEFEEESYYKWLEENPNARKAMEVDDELDALDYDAGDSMPGNAHTMATVNDKEFAGHLESGGQSVSKELYDLAMQISWFKSGRGKDAGEAGLGDKERLASSSSNKVDTPNCEQFEFDKEDEQGMAVPKPGTDRLVAVKQAFMCGFDSASTEEGGYNLNARIIDAEYDDMNTGGREEAEKDGNATGPVSPSQAISSLDVHSPSLLPENPRSSPWELRSGTMGSCQDTVSIFTCDTEHGASEYDLDKARSALIRMRYLEHPALLKLLQILQTESSLIIVTEKVSPLKQYLTESMAQVDHSSGLLQICSLFSFLYYEAKLKHNNINLNSVFVASNGDWKLGGFEFSVGVDEEESPLQHHLTPPQKYKPPEGKVPIGAPSWSHDTWSFGCLLWEIFNLGSNDLNLAFLNNIPQNMHTVLKQCLARNPMKRPSPKKIEELLLPSPEARITTSSVPISQPADVRFSSTNDDAIKDRLGPNAHVGGITSAALGLSKHDYSTMPSITESSLSYYQNGVSVNRERTEDQYFNADDEKEAALEDIGGYQPAHCSPGPGDGVNEDDTLDAYRNELEKEASNVVTITAPVVTQEQQLRGFQKAEDAGASGSSLPRVNKRGRIAEQPVVEMKGVRDDVEEEDGNAAGMDLADTGFSLTDTSKDVDQPKKIEKLQQYVCPVCGKSYVQKQSLRRHRQRDHKCPLEELLPKKKFKCTQCIKSFSFVQGLNRHIKGGHSDSVGQISVVQTADTTSNPASKPTLCPYEQIREDNIREKIMKFNSLNIKEDIDFLKNCD